MTVCSRKCSLNLAKGSGRHLSDLEGRAQTLHRRCVSGVTAGPRACQRRGAKPWRRNLWAAEDCRAERVVDLYSTCPMYWESP